MRPAVDINTIKFDEKGLVPAIAQDYATGEVLMMAYMNREAIEKTLSTGKAHYFSRSRNTLWLKGETSKNFQELKAIYYDCDEDTILLKINQLGVACHTGKRSCFFRRLDKGEQEPAGLAILAELFKIIEQRKKASAEKSYVASLYAKGIDKILEKVEEESGELVEAAKDGKKKEIIHEMADLWFHTLVLLGQKDISLQEILNELQRRSGMSGIEEKAARKKRP
ncbi:MAG: bifunctional phosphoribosyl-AMP cyclohydrolase/phosphoribosyl-ATP pyrophosphatase [Deltaproteobacteria bacterium RIFCSPLOWO2_12_FULL_43_16]|nr:MAG: bifunctional phosphoribosyl-AMP cyclohydrolase/phosphoribosyl-ATP pyrophosphatase [Deltaproteobacteria bacterium GWA2_43_19]OGQ35613.1 MAG: bifunctional phosphoribosyl-AMP cyclohydrolase/phosphoribosyl-ATP pyrophosphatase [Deltaproteobacteria bacterium RIFCSPLOWO2_01_FULL_42_9]OGQ57708.1 MAG: bifunctional phosphoribosyl-AMP cyclohydrolase/phosphoribosyl-ATP pyrophosphatase [Deltaproteobacteria bacterium RIFCSPLOWO2_12_FULL_43_16]HBR18287.1 bifunctional phosphoribosyl-AMP cyclohydrolase/p